VLFIPFITENNKQLLSLPLLTILFLQFYLNRTQGKGDFSKLKMTGKWQVGFKEFRTQAYGNEVAVFYPIDKIEYD
jgi:hypothetical protein